jgi:hypothetical protein
LAPPLCSAFARTVARTAVAAEFTATSTGAITGTAAEFTATTSTALTAIRAFAAVFAARLLSAGGRNEDGLIRHAEQGGELALQRGPEADGGLDRDDDGLNLDTRTVFTTRAVFTTRTTVAFRARTAVAFEARTTIAFEARTTIAFGARAAVAFTARTTIAFGAGFATRAVALRDAGLAAFFDGAFGAAFTRFTAGTRLAFGARFTTFTRFTLLALFRGVLLGEGTSEVLGQLRRIFDDATGRAGCLTIGGRGSGATGSSTATELLRRRDGTGLGGGFGRGPDHGQRREFRVGGLQLGFVEAGCGGADFIGACVRGGLVGGDWLLALGFFLAHVAYVGAAFVVADRMMRPFRCGAATRFVGPLVTEDEPPWGAEMSRERLPERM